MRASFAAATVGSAASSTRSTARDPGAILPAQGSQRARPEAEAGADAGERRKDVPLQFAVTGKLGKFFALERSVEDPNGDASRKTQSNSDTDEHGE